MPDLPERYDQWCKVSHGHEMLRAATGLWVLYTELDKMEQRALSAEAEVERLKEDLKGWYGYKRDIDEALNSGDGSYRP